MSTTDKVWGEGVVTWKALITLLTSMVFSGATLLGYVLSMHADQPHAQAVDRDELHKIEERISRQEERHTNALVRIEEKIDRLIIAP